jgi:hypothetical protein
MSGRVRMLARVITLSAPLLFLLPAFIESASAAEADLYCIVMRDRTNEIVNISKVLNATECTHLKNNYAAAIDGINKPQGSSVGLHFRLACVYQTGGTAKASDSTVDSSEEIPGGSGGSCP